MKKLVVIVAALSIACATEAGRAGRAGQARQVGRVGRVGLVGSKLRGERW